VGIQTLYTQTQEQNWSMLLENLVTNFSTRFGNLTLGRSKQTKNYWQDL